MIEVIIFCEYFADIVRLASIVKDRIRENGQERREKRVSIVCNTLATGLPFRKGLPTKDRSYYPHYYHESSNHISRRPPWGQKRRSDIGYLGPIESHGKEAQSRRDAELNAVSKSNNAHLNPLE